MDTQTADAVEWLLASDEPAVRQLTRRHLLGDATDDDRADVPAGPAVSALLSGQEKDGGFGEGPYRKWTGAHWRLVALAELEAPADDARVAAMAEHVLEWISADLLARHRVVDGLPRVHASIHGNALGACTRLGLADDPRTHRLAEALVSWQWPDGGWNCSIKARGHRSSFHESHRAAWGLNEYARATGHEAAASAADRTAELFLEHRVFRRSGDGDPIHPRWMKLVHPSYWHYDVLSGLTVLAALGRVTDTRAEDALDHLEEQRGPDGRWQPQARWWRPATSRASADVVDRGRPGRPSPWLTLTALRVLKTAGR
ncbi:prenyltransferase/squalene oxidase repeat-containing protein [Terrabacter terrigena]|uniref:Prenyltransferase n=1 Tax=Terrabacter terrigena TaxID=574718 RepID=A0ABW3N2A2_9MICO